MLSVGTKIWFRGQFAEQHSIRGEIEVVDIGRRFHLGDVYGVRLENGNFHWATPEQVNEDNSC